MRRSDGPLSAACYAPRSPRCFLSQRCLAFSTADAPPLNRYFNDQLERQPISLMEQDDDNSTSRKNPKRNSTKPGMSAPGRASAAPPIWYSAPSP